MYVYMYIYIYIYLIKVVLEYDQINGATVKK